MGSRRPPFLKPRFRPFPLGGWLALLLTLAAPLTGPVRADELVRQVQEELRKRNVYFGDVDGTLSPPTAAALRRYQQRKGFPATGQPDAVTLHSLMIPLPPTLAAASAASPAATTPTPPPSAAAALFPALASAEEALPWPDVTVLRSDEGRRQLPPEAADLEARPAPGPTRPPRPPPAAAARHRLTVEEARAFIARYLQAGQTNDPPAELAFYAESVDYFNEGVVDRHFIGADIARYDHRWPERHFTLLEPFTIANTPDGDPDKTVVNFRYQFANRGSKYLVHGRTDNTWTLAGDNPANLRIVAIKEERVPRANPGPGAGAAQPAAPTAPGESIAPR